MVNEQLGGMNRRPIDPVDGSPGSQRDADELRRRELGGFLRSRRERISPGDVGLPVMGRRRTPGLRREEVAQLAGVGVTWYTWLEQGREIQASAQVVVAIARTLMLDPHERTHLFTLAGIVDPAAAQDHQVVPPVVQLMLDKLEPYPAAVQNARFDILAYNRTYGRLIDDLDSMPVQDRNSLWLVFTHPAWQRALVDWERDAERLVAQYRAAMAEHMAEPAWKCHLKRLQEASPKFAELWERHEVAAPEGRTKVFRNPQVGLMRMDFTYLWLGERVGTRLATYAPADDETRARLHALYAMLASPVAAQTA
jgi:transcriptional regulator with XRE-family HTH domain